MDNDPILPKIWIPKYALTQGVLVATDVRHCVRVSDKMVEVPAGRGSTSFTAYFHKPHWHTTEAEALAQVQEMTDAEVKSLEKKRTKLESSRKRFATVEGLVTKPWGGGQ